MTDSVDGKRVAPALALLLTGLLSSSAIAGFFDGPRGNDVHHSDHAAQNDGDATRTTGDLSLSLSK
jgi:hypothetical protein